VTIGGKPAVVYFVSPGQVNVLAPDVAPGDVPVVVTNNGVGSAALKVHAGSVAPAFFQWGASEYALATRYPDNAFVANPSLGAGYVAAEPGDVLILWGTGFGGASPAVTVTVAGMTAMVIGAALSPGLLGVYQVAIQLPDSLPSGDTLLKATVAALSTPDNVYLFIH
jgi:uncharacterized protein (TIGR03437 family)